MAFVRALYVAWGLISIAFGIVMAFVGYYFAATASGHGLVHAWSHASWTVVSALLAVGGIVMGPRFVYMAVKLPARDAEQELPSNPDH